MDAIDNLKGGIPNTHKYQHKNSIRDSDTGKTVRLVKISGGQQLELF
jgi:hypothetical protein